MEELRRRGGARRTLAVILAALLAGSLGTALLLGRIQGGGRTVVTSDLIGERLEQAGDLVGLEYWYKDVTSLDKARYQLWGFDIPFTGNRAIFTYEGVIKYGVDVGAVDVEVGDGTVTLTIPESKIVSHEIPEESIEVFDVGRNIFNPVTIQDYVDFQTERKAEMEREAAARGLPEAAREKAGEALRALLAAMPDMDPYVLTLRYA